MSMDLNTSERNGLVELALQTDMAVYGAGGEDAVANQVISIGLDKLSKLTRYPGSGEEAEALELDSALRSLKVALSQRHKTVDEFYTDALEAVI